MKETQVLSPKDLKIQELEARILILEEAVKISLKMLDTWDDISKKMLYPHQHNTHSVNNKIITELKKVVENDIS